MFEEVDKLYDFVLGFLHAHNILEGNLNHLFETVALFVLEKTRNALAFTLGALAYIHNGLYEEVQQHQGEHAPCITY